MRIANPIETHGQFWLPSQADKRLPGILKITEKGTPSLELFGSFEPLAAGRRTLQNQVPQRILGVTADKGLVTLEDCLTIRRTDSAVGSREPLSKSVWQVGWAFCGTHFEKEISFSSMHFAVEGLDEWFIFYYSPFSSNGDPAGAMSQAFNPPKPITFQVSGDLTVSLNMLATTSSGLFHQSMTTEMSITLDADQLRLFPEFLEILRKIRDFLCLAFDRSVSYTSITGSRQELNAPNSARNSVEIYRQLEPFDLQPEEFGPGRFLLQFDSIADNIGHFLRRWLDNYQEYEPTFNLYFSVKANRHMHLEGRFLFLVHGIESLHRRSSSETLLPAGEFEDRVKTVLSNTPSNWKSWLRDRLRYGNELPLRTRITQMVEPFNKLFGTESERKDFIGKVVNTRNFLTHYDPSLRNRAVTDSATLLRLYNKLEGLVQLHLLRLLGISDADIVEIAMQYPILKDKLTSESMTT